MQIECISVAKRNELQSKKSNKMPAKTQTHPSPEKKDANIPMDLIQK